jgi:hypothetical protein
VEKRVLVFAPGRVELLGNHTDYNEGLALAAAINLGVTVRAEKLDADVIEVSSETNGREVRVSLKNLQRLEEEPWANYPIGVIKSFREAGFDIGGLRLRQERGSVFGFHLGWSGNWRWVVDRSPHGELLVQAGELFLPGELLLEPGQFYESPPLYHADVHDIAKNQRTVFKWHRVNPY